jgi:hypothetical protein
MQAQGSSRSRNEREDKRTQRAVLSLLLHEFPAQMTRESLRCRGFVDLDALERAINGLAMNGLLWLSGVVVLPSLAARHFDWLELS